MNRRYAICSLVSTLAAAVLLAVPGAVPQEPPTKDRAKAVSETARADQKADYHQRELKAQAHVQELLKNLRTEIQAKKLTFEVGYTTALDIPLEKLAGTRAPAPEELAKQARVVNEHAVELLKIDTAARDEFAKTNPGVLKELTVIRQATCAEATSFDWRKPHKVTPVRNQDGCGSCWDFTAMGAFESSYAIRNSTPIDTSEQQILDCSGGGSCAGGWWMPVFEFLIQKGVATEASYPYTATDGACKPNVPSPYHAVAWGYVQPDGGIPSVQEMKQAMCEHGALSVAVYVTPAFQAYTGGIFNEHDTTHGINHGVTLIGWDDIKHAWLIKNSWGAGWGETGGFGTERGYMWIAYDSNNIGYHASWVQAKSALYHLPPIYFERLKTMKPIAEVRTVPK